MNVDEWARASCAAQGVPLKVTDPETVARIATLLQPMRGAPMPAKRGAKATVPPRTDYPEEFPVLVTKKDPHRVFAEKLAMKMAGGDKSRIRWTGPLDFVIANR